jgi:hypothetical protein
MDVEAVVQSVESKASQLGPSTVYVHRLPHLVFTNFTSLQMDATSLTVVGHFNGILIRKDTSDARYPMNDDPETKAKNSLESAPWQIELEDPFRADEPILEKVLVFDFGQLAAKTQPAAPQEGDDEAEKATVLCYPSGRDLASLWSSGHMVMDPFEGRHVYGDIFDHDFSPDEDELFDLMYGDSEDSWCSHGIDCMCGEE